jgi:hypothetical protein
MDRHAFVWVVVRGSTPCFARASVGSDRLTIVAMGHLRRDLSATMYGFSLPGSTWLIECRLSTPNRESMRQSCAQALDSLKSRP